MNVHKGGAAPSMIRENAGEPERRTISGGIDVQACERQPGFAVFRTRYVRD